MKRKSNWLKNLLQWGTLAAIVGFVVYGLTLGEKPADVEAYCPFGGLQALGSYLVNNSLACTMSMTQIMVGVMLAVGVILFSKLFCGYLCPLGTVSEWMGRGGKKLKVSVEIRPGSIADRLLRAVKYALLFYVFYMSASSSELFCKNFDPYYAVATGFKGEITLWMSIVTVSLVLVGGLVVSRFWCRYICPLGALSNGLKFWLAMVVMSVVYLGLNYLGAGLEWWWMLVVFCLAGYLLEILSGKPSGQVVHVVRDSQKCGGDCLQCQKHCPYDIKVNDYNGRVRSVDCTLCGECVAACPMKALSVKPVGVKAESKFMKFLPSLLAVVFVAVAMVIGSRFELPTIDESWDVPEGVKLETLKVEGLKTVKCYGSSMAFKAKLEHIRGVYGVKTYVGSHTVVIKYDPKRISEARLQEEIFEPSHFRVNSPDPNVYKELKCVTIRTEKMTSKVDLNMLGLQFRTTGKNIFGLESEYNCPLIVRVYMDPEENLDEAWFREVVNKKELEMPIHGGATKVTPVDFEFVRLERGETRIGIEEYLTNMLDTFKAEFNGEYPSADTLAIRKRAEVYEGKPQFVYEIADQNYEKPIVMRALPYLSNHLSKEEGVIGMYMQLNKELVPSIQVRFAAPMTAERIWELMTMETWTITYKRDDVREEPARLAFKKEGTCYTYEPKN